MHKFLNFLVASYLTQWHFQNWTQVITELLRLSKQFQINVGMCLWAPIKSTKSPRYDHLSILIRFINFHPHLQKQWPYFFVKWPGCIKKTCIFKGKLPSQVIVSHTLDKQLDTKKMGRIYL